MLLRVIDGAGNAKDVPLRRIVMAMVVVVVATSGVACWASQPVWRRTPGDLLRADYDERWEHYPNRLSRDPDRFHLRHKNGLIQSGELRCGEWHGPILSWRGALEYETSDYWYGVYGLPSFRRRPFRRNLANRAKVRPMSVDQIVFRTRDTPMSEPRRG